MVRSGQAAQPLLPVARGMRGLACEAWHVPGSSGVVWGLCWGGGGLLHRLRGRCGPLGCGRHSRLTTSAAPSQKLPSGAVGRSLGTPGGSRASIRGTTLRRRSSGPGPLRPAPAPALGDRTVGSWSPPNGTLNATAFSSQLELIECGTVRTLRIGKPGLSRPRAGGLGVRSPGPGAWPVSCLWLAAAPQRGRTAAL